MATTSPFTTPQAVEALRPNVIAFPPVDLIPTALIIAATTKVATIEGDEPVVKAPFLDVGEAGFTPEGADIDENLVDSREVEIATGKVSIYTLVSREQYGQDGFKNLMSEELKRAVTVKADNAFLTQPAPPGKKITPPAGLLVQDHTEGGAIEDDP